MCINIFFQLIFDRQTRFPALSIKMWIETCLLLYWIRWSSLLDLVPVQAPLSNVKQFWRFFKEIHFEFVVGISYLIWETLIRRTIRSPTKRCPLYYHTMPALLHTLILKLEFKFFLKIGCNDVKMIRSVTYKHCLPLLFFS